MPARRQLPIAPICTRRSICTFRVSFKRGKVNRSGRKQSKGEAHCADVEFVYGHPVDGVAPEPLEPGLLRTAVGVAEVGALQSEVVLQSHQLASTLVALISLLIDLVFC